MNEKEVISELLHIISYLILHIDIDNETYDVIFKSIRKIEMEYLYKNVEEEE